MGNQRVPDYNAANLDYRAYLSMRSEKFKALGQAEIVADQATAKRYNMMLDA